MILRAYEKNDIWEILDRQIISKLGFNLIEDINEDLTWTVIHDHFIVGCGGFRPFWNGVYEVWLAAKSPEFFFKHKIAVTKLIRQQIAFVNAHRLQATSLEKNIKDTRLLRFLGFEIEGILKKYGPDKSDYFIWGLTK
jgi:hypothetical protein